MKKIMPLLLSLLLGFNVLQKDVFAEEGELSADIDDECSELIEQTDDSGIAEEDTLADHLEETENAEEIVIYDESAESSKEDQTELIIEIPEDTKNDRSTEILETEEILNQNREETKTVSNDEEYIDELINKYWFITDDIKNDELYYKLEGYLFPDTYFYKNKDVTVKEIFNKMIEEMANVLNPLKDDILKSDLSVHEILTLASMVQKESPDNEEYRKNIASVFLNRIERKMSLGSDVTTYYALKIDNAKKYIDEKCGGKNCIDYNYKSPYNTRLSSGMSGRLPVGPIGTVSKEAINAAVYPSDTDYIYFLANIKTGETFFFENYNDFLKKKSNLQSVNGGL